jgi:hypothetical protein
VSIVERSAILEAISMFDPGRSPRRATGQEWLDLDDLVQQLAVIAPADLEAVPILLGVFERFPRHDGYGVFWTLLHYVEGVVGYQEFLLSSVRRSPNEMTVAMLRRWINSGAVQFDGVDLLALLEQVEPLAPEVTCQP